MGARGRAGARAKLKALHVKNRAAKKAFTRARAERLIARTTTLSALMSDPRLAGHKNSHVRAKFEHKRSTLDEGT